MGTVWLARRADETFDKLVAIKVLKRGTDTEEVLSRFKAERQILARLDHPNIARLFDAGETEDGLPYFVLEFVDGLPITAYAREHKLSVDDRVEMFLKVCDAIKFAHQKLVVHRDLKPSNILVAAEANRSCSIFGIAKLLLQLTKCYLALAQTSDRVVNLRLGAECGHKSIELWQEMKRRGMLNPADVPAADECNQLELILNSQLADTTR